MSVIDPKTIDGQIECLARLTDAPTSFVAQVRNLFRNKGIALSEDAGPYVAALEAAFRREEMIRRSAGRTKSNLRRLNEQFGKLGETYRRQLEKLKRVRSELDLHASRLSAGKGSADPEKTQRKMRTVLDGYKMVPGPEDLQ